MTKIQKKMTITFGRANSSDRYSNFWGIKINIKSKPETPSTMGKKGRDKQQCDKQNSLRWGRVENRHVSNPNHLE
jgi:hypothetical protein